MCYEIKFEVISFHITLNLICIGVILGGVSHIEHFMLFLADGACSDLCHRIICPNNVTTVISCSSSNILMSYEPFHLKALLLSAGSCLRKENFRE